MQAFEYASIRAWIGQAWRQQGPPLWIRGLLGAITGGTSFSPSAIANDPGFLAATELPSAKGLANARSLALLGSALAGAGVVGLQGPELLSRQGLGAAMLPGPASIEEFLGLGFNIKFEPSGHPAGSLMSGPRRLAGWPVP